MEGSKEMNLTNGFNQPLSDHPQGTQPTTVMVRNAVKNYGKGSPILNNFNMTVQKGTIYSLLGASGCGKTTLLSCIVGMRHLNSGEISVFGYKPGSKACGVPGKSLGYMPQETALYNDFSIAEILQYFGFLFGMSSFDVQSKRDFLIKLLDLPQHSSTIKALSGGQKRRVSLAVALINSPELLILDEPTVGVDPLLRFSIWNHLVELASTQNTTIIITTHYIEESRQSNIIGLMREGQLISESSPKSLLEQYNTNILEDVVLELCKKQAGENQQRQNQHLQVVTSVKGDKFYQCRLSSPNSQSATLYGQPVKYYSDGIQDSWNRMKALVLKNTLVMTRNFVLVLFMILIPPTQVYICGSAIGNDPKPLEVGVVNFETKSCLSQPLVKLDGCNVENLSCRFLSKIPKDTMKLLEYKSEELARKAVRSGDTWGFMVFPKGYSDSVYTRTASGNIIENSTLEGSKISLELDMSNAQIGMFFKKYIYDAYKDFARELLKACGFYPELSEAPIKYRTPIYGSEKLDFREYSAPSSMLGLLFFIPLCSSGISIIWDKKQGTLERARVAGVKTWEILLAFLLVESCILIIQTGLSYCVLVFALGIGVQGSVILALCNIFLVGLGGLSMGFMYSSFCEEEIEAILLSVATFLPNFVLAGFYWPILGMPLYLKYVAYFVPCTLAAESFRSIITRGWGITHQSVWIGFVSIISWIVFFWIVTILVHRRALLKK